MNSFNRAFSAAHGGTPPGEYRRLNGRYGIMSA